jgi:hypothetical protein
MPGGRTKATRSGKTRSVGNKPRSCVANCVDERQPMPLAAPLLAWLIGTKKRREEPAIRLLLFRFDAEIRVARSLSLPASAACRGVPAPRAGGPSVAKNQQRRVPFRVPLLVLVAQRRHRWRGPPAGTPRFAPLVPDGAPSRARLPYERIRVLRLGEKEIGGALAVAPWLALVPPTEGGRRDSGWNATGAREAIRRIHRR